VHMLTKEAFNALLKTLEEPPAHVVFILATTEEEKLLDTILSRCQVFRMRTPSREVLQKAVLDVAKKEGFTLFKDAADLIAIAADGSFRDALGITQKVILASSSTEVESDEVADIIGAPKQVQLQKLITALSSKNKEEALMALADVVDSHIDARLFMKLLLARVRAVILLRNAPAVGARVLSQMSSSETEYIKKLAEDKTSALNSHALLALLRASESVGKTALPLLPLELAVLEICG
jgi:DNA polymerase III subunit gamma/tau